jgi:hypothetical protein
MFLEQTPEYTITADDDQWILIWHPDGIVYQARKGGGFDPLPRGRRKFFSRLPHLVSSLLDMKSRRCGGLAELKEKIDEFVVEMSAIAKMKEIK